MVIVLGPLHFGWLVAVGEGKGSAVMADLAGWVDGPAELEIVVFSVEMGGTVAVEDIEFVLGIYWAISRLGPRGVFHL